MADRLNGYRILILETREEAQFSRLLTEQGADVLQCPMFTIHDAPDPAPIEAWIRRFIEKPCDDMVLMTGEGLRRLMKVVRRIGAEQEFVAALGKRAEIHARPQARQGAARNRAGAAGDDGKADLRGRRRDAVAHRSARPPSRPAALSGQGSRRADRRDQGARRAEVDTVLPYVYDAQAADANIVTAIDEMAAGRIDAIALTNLGQVRRLVEVARARGCEAKLREGLARTPIASVGPAVSDELKAQGLRTDIYPADDAFFMRPLISAMAAALAKNPPRALGSRAN